MLFFFTFLKRDTSMDVAWNKHWMFPEVRDTVNNSFYLYMFKKIATYNFVTKFCPQFFVCLYIFINGFERGKLEHHVYLKTDKMDPERVIFMECSFHNIPLSIYPMRVCKHGVDMTAPEECVRVFQDAIYVPAYCLNVKYRRYCGARQTWHTSHR